MGRVEEAVILSNFMVKVDSIELKMLVDTGSALVGLTPDLIEKLQLKQTSIRKARTSNGVVDRRIYSGLEVNVQGRVASVEVSELPIGTPLLLGYLALETLDFVVNPVKQKLVGNPEHKGELIMDLL